MRVFYAQEKMACTERAKLLAEYQRTTQALRNAVSELNQKTGVSFLDRYRQLTEVTDIARIDCEKARDDLNRHIAGHGCTF
jgi:hypothetical protein